MILFRAKTGSKSDSRENYLSADQTTQALSCRSKTRNSKSKLSEPDLAIENAITLLLTFVLSSMYIHGGRDLKEGSIDTMWRVSLTGIHALKQDPYYPVEWECVQTHGKGPGKISHHTCSVIN